MREKNTTKPSLLDTAPAHRQAIKDGDDHYRAWSQNVADRYKGMTIEDIKKDLRDTSYPFAICFEHWIGDFNMASGIRNANAFNAREVFYIGDKKWDRRGAVGVYNYTEVQWLSTVDDLLKLQEKYVIVGIDNVPGSVPLSTYHWEPNTLMVFGEEGTGLTPAMQSLCRDIVEIEMFGSVRSLNCGVASGIVMHDFTRQMRLK
jgi:tRNA G18 (ribose-2'-O)-methylase SpoU